MEIVMRIMILMMIVGFSIFGHHKMMDRHDKECPKEERVIKHDGHEKDDCKKATESPEDKAVDKDN